MIGRLKLTLLREVPQVWIIDFYEVSYFGHTESHFYQTFFFIVLDRLVNYDVKHLLLTPMTNCENQIVKTT